MLASFWCRENELFKTSDDNSSEVDKRIVEHGKLAACGFKAYGVEHCFTYI